MPKPKQPPGSSTRAVHGGEREGRPRVSDALTTPIVQTATYWFRDTQEVIDYQEGRRSSFEYGRYGNPTVRTVEEKLMELEGAEACLVSASGMNSITTLLLALLPRNGRLVTTHDCYRRTRQFIGTVLPKLGVEATVIDPADLAGLEQALELGPTLFFSESPTNPYLRVVDIPRVSELCHAAGMLVVIDSTFASPINQQALSLGADIVLHSGTKYLAGHNDVMAGVLLGSEARIAPIRALHGIMGGGDRSARCVPVAPRSQDSRPARAALEPQRGEARRLPRASPWGGARPLPRIAQSPRPRGRCRADVGLRRRGQLPGARQP